VDAIVASYITRLAPFDAIVVAHITDGRRNDDIGPAIGLPLASPNDFLHPIVDKCAAEDANSMKTAPLQLNRSVEELMGRSRHVMGFTQQMLGEALGSSKRTAHRWEAGKASPTVSQVRALAAMVFPREPALAEQLAAAASTTLLELGLVQPPAPPSPAPAPPPRPPTRLVVHAVVCVAADELATAPETVRRALHAAFKCARELNLSLADVEDALKPEAPKPLRTRSPRSAPVDR
jgi:DNA-binding XRE family transcriptional regulator